MHPITFAPNDTHNLHSAFIQDTPDQLVILLLYSQRDLEVLHRSK